MPAEIVLHRSPDAEALRNGRERLAAVRAVLVEREAEVAGIRS